MIILLGIAISLLIFAFIITRKIRLDLKIFFLILLGAATYFAFSYSSLLQVSVRSLEDFNWYEAAPWKHLICFGSMLFGMTTNYLFDYLQLRIKFREAQNAEQEELLKPVFIWEKLVLPLLISVLLFGYFWSEQGNETLSLSIIFIAYQNGFFWQTLLTKVKP